MQAVRFSRRCLMLAGALSCVPRLAEAKNCESVSLPDRIQVEGKALLLNGMGVREATVFNVNVYVAGLYLETKSQDGEGIAASTQFKRLTLVFVREVGRSDISEAFREGFKKSAGGEAGKLQDRVEKMIALMPDLKVGDRISFTHVPDKGVEVAAGGRSITLPGSDFARALFRIWLGPNPPNAGLKRGLLGGACG